MIVYDARKLGGYDIMLHKTGSALFSVHSFPQAVLAALLTLLLSHLPVVGQFVASQTSLGQSSVYFGAVSFVVGFILVYRMQLANERYRDAQIAYFTMATSLHEMAMQIDAFSGGCDAVSREVVSTILRWLRLYHEMALEELQGFEFSANHPRTSLTIEEAQLLVKEQQRATRIMNWIYKQIVGNREVFKVNDAILTRVFQLGGEANTNFNLARRVAETPFPFAFAQIAFTVIHLWAFLTPVAGAAFLGETYVYAALVSFFSTWALFAVNEAAAQLENPFEDAANDFPLVYYSVAHNDNISAVEYMQVPYNLAKNHYDIHHEGNLKAQCPSSDRYDTRAAPGSPRRTGTNPKTWVSPPIIPGTPPLGPLTDIHVPVPANPLTRSNSTGQLRRVLSGSRLEVQPAEPERKSELLTSKLVRKLSVRTKSLSKRLTAQEVSEPIKSLLRSSSLLLSPKHRALEEVEGIRSVRSGSFVVSQLEVDAANEAKNLPRKASTPPARSDNSRSYGESYGPSASSHASVFDLFSIDPLTDAEHSKIDATVNNVIAKNTLPPTRSIANRSSAPSESDSNANSVTAKVATVSKRNSAPPDTGIKNSLSKVNGVANPKEHVSTNVTNENSVNGSKEDEIQINIPANNSAAQKSVNKQKTLDASSLRDQVAASQYATYGPTSSATGRNGHGSVFDLFSLDALPGTDQEQVQVVIDSANGQIPFPQNAKDSSPAIGGRDGKLRIGSDDQIPINSGSQRRRAGSSGDLMPISEHQVVEHIPDDNTECSKETVVEDSKESPRQVQEFLEIGDYNQRPLHFHAVADDTDAMVLQKGTDRQTAAEEQANIARNYNTVGGVNARNMLDQLEFERAMMRKRFAMEAHNEFVRKRAQGERRRHTRKALSRHASTVTRPTEQRISEELPSTIEDQFTVKEKHSGTKSKFSLRVRSAQGLNKVKNTILPKATSPQTKRVFNHINSNPTELRMNGEFLRFT